MPEEQTPEILERAVKRVIDAAGVLVRPSDLDLVVFFARHPRSLLASESLSAFLGYELKDIAESLDTLLAAGILRRRQTSAHAARLYELIADGPSAGDWLETLLALAKTRSGRLALLTEMARRSRGEQRMSLSTPDSARLGPRRLAAPGSAPTKTTKTG